MSTPATTEQTFELSSICGGPFQTNAYLIADKATRECAIVDPGYGADEQWGEVIAEENLKLTSILLTHGHIDHTCGVAVLARAFPGVPILMHRDDMFMITGGNDRAVQMFGLPPFEKFDVTEFIDEGRPVRVGETAFEVLFVPGHSPGHVAFLNGGILIGGDVVFLGSIGRTDLPGGDYIQLMESIHNRILTLPDETIIAPGHGPATSVGQERATNPFILEYERSRRA